MSQPKPVTGNPVGRSARAAARRLAPDHGPELEVQVEAALHARSTNQYFDPIDLGSLIVSVATLAWTIYDGSRTKTPKPPRETLTERVRANLTTDNPTPADLDKIIEIIVEEIAKETGD